MKKQQVDVDDLTTLAQFANAIGLSNQAVTNWGKRHAEFPAPLLSVGSDARSRSRTLNLYSRRALDAWLRATGRGNLIPERPRRPICREARCTLCGETFNPVDDDDLEHAERADGVPCGGDGALLGYWLAS